MRPLDGPRLYTARNPNEKAIGKAHPTSEYLGSTKLVQKPYTQIFKIYPVELLLLVAPPPYQPFRNNLENLICKIKKKIKWSKQFVSTIFY